MKQVDVLPYKFGQIWYSSAPVDLAEKDTGYTIGARPVVIISDFIFSSHFVMVAPITSVKEGAPAKKGVSIVLESRPGVILIDGIHPMRLKFLNKYLGALNHEKTTELRRALEILIGSVTDVTDDEVDTYCGRTSNPTSPQKEITRTRIHTDQPPTTDKKSKPKTNSNTKRIYRRASDLTDEDMLYILTHNNSQLMCKYDISNTSANRYRQRALEKVREGSKERVSKVSKMPIEFMSDVNKMYFCLADTDYLAVVNGRDTRTIRTYKSRFASNIGLLVSFDL